MKRKVEKSLRWLVAVTLTLGGLPASPEAIAQIYPVQDAGMEEKSRVISAEKAEGDSNAAVKEKELPGGSLEEASALQKPTIDRDVSMEPAAETDKVSNYNEIREKIEKGLEQNFKTEVKVTLEKSEIPNGLTSDKMAEGGATSDNVEISFKYLTAEGEIGTGVAQSIINLDGTFTIKGASLEPGSSETPSPAESPDPNTAGSEPISLSSAPQDPSVMGERAIVLKRAVVIYNNLYDPSYRMQGEVLLRDLETGKEYFAVFSKEESEKLKKDMVISAILTPHGRLVEGNDALYQGKLMGFGGEDILPLPPKDPALPPKSPNEPPVSVDPAGSREITLKRAEVVYNNLYDPSYRMQREILLRDLETGEQYFTLFSDEESKALVKGLVISAALVLHGNLVEGRDPLYKAKLVAISGGKPLPLVPASGDINGDGIVDFKDEADTARGKNQNEYINNGDDEAYATQDSNRDGIIDMKDSSYPLKNEASFEYPVGPASPYVNTQASDPDYTPIVVLPEERPIESGEDSILPVAPPKNDSEKAQAAEASFAALALPESDPVDNVPQDNGMMTLEEAMKRKGAGEGTIIDIDPRNPSQSPCGGGTQIKSPGGEGPTAWFCPGSPAPESEGPAAEEFTPVEEVVMSNEESLKPQTVIETASDSKPLLNQDGSVWAKPVVFKNPSAEVTAEEPSLEIRSLTPSLNQKEEEVVRRTLNTPVVASFVRAVRNFQQDYKPRSSTLSELRTEIKAAFGDVKAIVNEDAEKRIEAAKAEAENKIQDARAAFDTRKESVRNSSLSEKNNSRSAGQSKKEIKNALKETIVLIRKKADTRIAEFSDLYQSADKLIKEYRQAYAAGTPFPAMSAFQNNTVFAAENSDSLLG